MNALLATLLCIAVAPASTHWFNAADLTDAPQSVSPGTYAAWAWSPAHSAGQLTINDQELRANAGSPDANATYHWVKVGDIACPDGKVTITLGDGVAAVALSTAPDFNPATVTLRSRVHGTPEAVIDGRGQQARHTHTVFTMPEFHSAAEWEAYAARLRTQVALTSGLYPLPDKTPLNAELSGKITHDDYTVEKVRFEAYPGFFVTGNLYKPLGDGPFPGMVSPHGHWTNGRTEEGERGSVPARGITLARMGIVTFMYDMIGYQDSIQFPHNWGTEKEKLWGIHPFAFQLWSSIRAIDFLQSLPEVAPDRIGCTGASGGGTQTFALTAIDPRIKVSAPVNMISSRMQGGCLCENAPILRLNNSNMEVGALMAPRPMLMVSATGDWTRETPRVEYPAIKSIFALYDAEDRIKNVHIDAPHNYNKDSREAMYRFMGRWLLNEPGWEDFTEPEYPLEAQEALRLYPDGQGADAPDQEIIEQVRSRIEAKWEKELSLAKADPAAFAAAHRNAFAQVLGAQVPSANDLACERFRMEEFDGYVQENWILGRKGADDAIPALFFRGTGSTPQDAVLLVSGKGKVSYIDASTGAPGPLVASLIGAGKAVLCIDPFLVGEQAGVLKQTKRMRVGGFMDTFQPTDTGYRVQDVITAAAFLRARRDLSNTLDVVGQDEAGVWVLLASAVDGAFATTIADLSNFDRHDDDAWVKRYYVPCIRSVGDVATAAGLIAPHTLYIAGSEAAQELAPYGAVSVGNAATAAQLATLLK